MRFLNLFFLPIFLFAFGCNEEETKITSHSVSNEVPSDERLEKLRGELGFSLDNKEKCLKQVDSWIKDKKRGLYAYCVPSGVSDYWDEKKKAFDFSLRKRSWDLNVIFKDAGVTPREEDFPYSDWEARKKENIRRCKELVEKRKFTSPYDGEVIDLGVFSEQMCPSKTRDLLETSKML